MTKAKTIKGLKARREVLETLRDQLTTRFERGDTLHGPSISALCDLERTIMHLELFEALVAGVEQADGKRSAPLLYTILRAFVTAVAPTPKGGRVGG